MNRSMLILALSDFYEVCQKKICNENRFVDLKNPELVKIAKKIIKESLKMKLTHSEQEAVDLIKRNIKRNKKHQKHKEIVNSRYF